MPVPNPILIYRITHIDNLDTILRRGGLFAPNHEPQDGLPYKCIHNIEIQDVRHNRIVPCEPGGTLHDYVPFYLGTRSPMLYMLHHNYVEGYDEGQEPLVYLVSSLDQVNAEHLRFVFTNGHAIAILSQFFSDPNELNNLNWNIINTRDWADDEFHPDRKRRKQAEFLIHRFCPWSAIDEIAVYNVDIKTRVQTILDNFAEECIRPVRIKQQWYY